MRLWDLSSGRALSASRPAAGTVRCLALDDALLVSGCTDSSMWAFHAGDEGADAGGWAWPLFDLSRPHVVGGHSGPVSSLCLTEAALYSGSWDCTGGWVGGVPRGGQRREPRDASLGGPGHGGGLHCSTSWCQLVLAEAAC